MQEEFQLTGGRKCMFRQDKHLLSSKSINLKAGIVIDKTIKGN